MVYKINLDTLIEGIKELEKIAINRLEIAADLADKGQTEYAIKQALAIEGIAKGMLQETPLILSYFVSNSKEIKERFGIEIPGYTS